MHVINCAKTVRRQHGEYSYIIFGRRLAITRDYSNMLTNLFNENLKFPFALKPVVVPVNIS